MAERQESSFEVPNTQLFIEPENLPPLHPLIERTLNFVADTSRVMGENFVMHYERDRHRVLKYSNPKSLDSLKRHNLHLPQFALFDSNLAPHFLEKTPFFEETIDPDNLLLIFQFPSLIARADKIRFGNPPSNKKTSVDWTPFRTSQKHKLWSGVHEYSDYKDLFFDRLNQKEEHDSDLYFYAWEVGFKNKLQEDGS